MLLVDHLDGLFKILLQAVRSIGCEAFVAFAGSTGDVGNTLNNVLEVGNALVVLREEGGDIVVESLEPDEETVKGTLSWR
jgi:hypothetical protein